VAWRPKGQEPGWPFIPHGRLCPPSQPHALGQLPASNESKLGPQAATMATAHKIAVISYTMIKNQVEYDETIWNARDAERKKRFEAKLKRQAKQLGYQLVPIEPQAA
jgi:hypothetical protein